MSMDRKTIEDSIKQAREFIVAGQAALERIAAEREQHSRRFGGEGESRPGDRSWGSLETGSLRRRSMDLTRKLAELRKY